MLAARRAGIHEATGAFIMGTASTEAMVAASLGLTSKAKLPEYGRHNGGTLLQWHLHPKPEARALESFGAQRRRLRRVPFELQSRASVR
jgi:hypothetical protein